MFVYVKAKSKNETEPIRAYSITLDKVRKHIANMPGMSITRFYDEAVQKILPVKTIKKRLDSL